MKRRPDFENFYVYEGNKVAYLAAQKIIEFPGELFNPLYVYANTGLGKTHLLLAIHAELNKKSPTKFFSAKEFEKALDETKVFDCSVIVDDIHSISSTYHGALLGAIDSALTSNQQMCFSGNAAPRDLKNFDSRLLSRFEGGLVCDILRPKEMALIDVIKKKSSEAGILLPEEIALELAQISTGSIRTIEGMINRIVAYSSLGSLSLDPDSVRMILKEFYPKGIYSPVSSLLEELKKNASEILSDVSEKLNVREEYKEKIYIWEMKGFDTTSLKPLLEGNVEKLKIAYDEFIKKVERLIELQKEFGSLDASIFPDEAMKIESMLFSPNHVDEIEELTSNMKRDIQVPKDKRAFEGYLVGACNKDAVALYKEQVVKYLGEKYNPFGVFGKEGTGRTRFLEEVRLDLETANKVVCFVDLDDEDSVRRFEKMNGVDVLVMDNFHNIFSFGEELRKKIFDVVKLYLDSGKAVIFSSATYSTDAILSEDEKAILECGIEVELKEPSSDIVEAYVKTNLEHGKAESLIGEGLPVFASFSMIDDFITKIAKESVASVTAVPASEAVELVETPVEQKIVSLDLSGETVETGAVSAEQTEEVITLGLPGEELTKEETSTDDKGKEIVGLDVSEKTVEETSIVSLGLPGEETISKQEIKQDRQAEESEGKAKEPVVKGEPLKGIKVERFIVKEISGELIEDNY